MITRIARTARRIGQNTWGRVATAAVAAAVVACMVIPGPPATVDWLSARTAQTVAFLAVWAAVTVSGAVTGVRRMREARRAQTVPGTPPGGDR
jgi:hypothetical protein